MSDQHTRIFAVLEFCHSQGEIVLIVRVELFEDRKYSFLFLDGKHKLLANKSVLTSRIDRGSRDRYKFPENLINREEVGGKIIILSIAMNRLHQPFEL